MGLLLDPLKANGNLDVNIEEEYLKSPVDQRRLKDMGVSLTPQGFEYKGSFAVHLYVRESVIAPEVAHIIQKTEIKTSADHVKVVLSDLNLKFGREYAGIKGEMLGAKYKSKV